jgi:tRNA(fMet)-specific endonuclease VapC
MPQVLLDTDTVSFLLRRHPAVAVQCRAYLAAHNLLTISVVTRYELIRGYLAAGATRQLNEFLLACERMAVIEVNQAIADRAAHVHADLTRRGLPIGDADILIAATALELGRAVVTGNEKHFSRIGALITMNWTI